jgi:hypothetical protein
MEQYCKECWELKSLSEFYNHYKWKNWVLSRCKDCIKKWRRSERERKIARIRDNKRSKTTKRIQYNTIKTKEYRLKNPLKYKAHSLISNYYKNNDRPNECSICNSNDNIELHHEDYNKPNEVIPLCSLCHSKYHKWEFIIDIKNTIFVPF